MRTIFGTWTVAGCAACALVLLAAAPAPAQLSSANFRLDTPTLSAGGAVGLENTGSGATASAGVTSGQAAPVGESVGQASGVGLETGFWSVPVPEPSTWALGLAALATLGSVTRRRRHE